MEKFPLLFIILSLMSCSCKEQLINQSWDSPFQQLWSSEEYQWVGTTQASSPLPLGDSLVFMSIGGDVVMVEQETGKVRWKTHVADLTNIQSNIFQTDGERIFATHTRDVRAFDIITGENVWLTEMPWEDRGGFARDKIAYVDERLFVSGWTNTHAIDAVSGEILWSIDLYGNARGVALYNDLILTGSDHKVYNSAGADTSAEGWIYALNIETGDSLWSLSINNGVGVIKMAPVIENDIMYIGTSWRKPFGVQAFDLNTKEELWHYQWPNAEFIVDHGIIVDDVLILSLAWDAIGGWDKNTGERLWVTYPTQNYNWSRIGYDGRYVYYAHGWKLHVIEPTTGEILHSTYGPNGEYVYTIAVTDKRIFINGWPRNMCWTTYDPEQDND